MKNKPATCHSIERRIRNQEVDVKDIEQLDLSELNISVFDEEMKKTVEKCVNLKVLLMCECGLQKLQNLPRLPQLEEIDLSSNSIKASELSKVVNMYPNLVFLSLAENNITKLKDVEILGKLKNLDKLELLDNQIEKLPDYREKIFQMLPNLLYLDNKDFDGNEEDCDISESQQGEEERQGQGEGQQDEEFIDLQEQGESYQKLHTMKKRKLDKDIETESSNKNNKKSKPSQVDEPDEDDDDYQDENQNSEDDQDDSDNIDLQGEVNRQKQLEYVQDFDSDQSLQVNEQDNQSP